jgi:hypothetical protein
MVVMELGMMFDLLYTKANVLQRWTGVVFRCASQTLMVVAFLLFLLIEHGFFYRPKYPDISDIQIKFYLNLVRYFRYIMFILFIYDPR